MRDVIVCDLGSTDQTRYVAEHAGCHFIAERRHRGGHRQGQGRLAALARARRAARSTAGSSAVVLHMPRKSTMPARVSRAPAASGCRSWRGCSRPAARSPKGWSSASGRRRVAGQECSSRSAEGAGARTGRRSSIPRRDRAGAPKTRCSLRRLAARALQMLVEARHDLHEIAGHVAVVELRLRGCRPRRRGRRRASRAARRRRWR